MQAIFFEQPILLGLLGCILAGLAAFVWIQSGARAALYTAVGLLAATVGLVLLSIQVVTDREQIEITLHEVAELVEQNDRDGVMRYVHPDAESRLTRFETELPRYRFEEARVTKVKKVTVDTQADPKTAIAEFNVYVEVEAQGQVFRVPRFVRTYFRQQGSQWRVLDFEHFDPSVGFRKPDTRPVPSRDPFR
jgi:hypothetical protein